MGAFKSLRTNLYMNGLRQDKYLERVMRLEAEARRNRHLFGGSAIGPRGGACNRVGR